MRATLLLLLRDHRGRPIGQRRAANAVMRSGAGLVARAFAGQGAGITHMGVGNSDAAEPEDFSREALRNEGVEGERLAGATEVAIPPEAFQFVNDATRRVILVRLRATLPDAAAVGTVREAGLLSRKADGATLYNRVTFAPLAKGDDHELTLFWEVAFPYGDLQALF
ncbi:hypothetical protein J8J14_13745 [Roseomonas sp. SSH11]|uniref:Uncharacterized protein n=1 Tax=Pararoseomonas baculiformis TaxID=2820812 RepID=A0ABS4AH34_9PROT|nr:hypothetical protein [Pararoseomonas baculiformis]MBP0445838.1 hypothetical protein [Pararoseomonas baculiformis]